MKKSTINIFTTLSLLLLISTLTIAQKHNYQKEMAKERIFDRLELTDSQEKEIEDFKYDQQMAAIDLKSDLEKNKLKLKELFDAENLDEDAILSLMEENNSIHNELAMMKVKMHLKMNSILTAEQREELKNLPRFGPGMGLGFCRNGEPGMGKGFGRNGKPGLGKGSGRDDNWRGMGRKFNDCGNCRFRDF